MKRILETILLTAIFLAAQGIMAQDEDDWGGEQDNMAQDEDVAPAAPAKKKAADVKKEHAPKGVKAPKAAKEPKAPKAAKVRPELQNLTVDGRISAEEIKSKKDETKTTTRYTLTDVNGTVIPLTAPKAPKKGPTPAINLADFVGKDVTVVAKGIQTEAKGKAKIQIKEIVTITVN